MGQHKDFTVTTANVQTGSFHVAQTREYGTIF
jgi:hypothetical protein